MPNAKEYKLLFLLKAQMDSALGSSFTGAKKYVADLQGKLKEYNNTLRDISAYKTQTQKIDELTQKYQNEGKSITEIDSLLEKKKQKLAETAEALEKAGVSTNNLTEEEQRLAQAVQETTAEMEKWTGLQNDVTDLANNLTAIQPVMSAIATGARGVIEAIAACVESAAKLQYTMSAVSAVSGATAEESAALTALAKETGATTIYTAEQAAQALETMGLAGMSAQQMMSGLPGVVKLASASGEDLTEMCSIVSDALNAFGLSGTEAVNEFADTLAKAATSSNTNVSVLGESLSYVESTAANLGYSIQDVSIALAQMANNALKGSVSGSALNTMLTRMSGANSTAADEMKALGLSMYNADGSAKELAVFLDELRTKFQQFGDDAQAAQVSAYKLAGQRGMRGLLSIVKASDEEWEKLSDAIYDYDGAAESISDIRMDNYTGQIYLLESAWDALKTTIGEQFLPEATYAAEILTNLTNGVNDLAEGHEYLLPVLAGVVSGFGVAAAAMSVVTIAAQAAKFALDQMNIALRPILGMAGVAGLFAAGAGGLIAAFLYANSTIEATSESIRELKQETSALTTESESALSSWNDLSQSFENESEKAYRLINLLGELQEEDQDAAATQKKTEAAVRALNEQLPDLNLQYDKLTGKLSMSTKEMRQFADAAESTTVNDVYDAQIEAEDALTDAKKKRTEAQKELNAAIAASGQEGTDIDGLTAMTADIQQAKAAFDEADAAVKNYEQVVSEAKEKTKEFEQSERDLADSGQLTQTQISAITDAVTEYEKVWGEAYNTVYEALQGQISLFSEADEITKTSTDELYGNLESQYEQLKSYQENLQTLADAGITFPEGMWAQLTDGSAEAQGAVAALAEEAKNGNISAIEPVISKYDELQTLIGKTSGTAASELEEVQEALDNVMDNINFDGGNLKEQGIDVGAGVISGLVLGLEEGGTEIKNASGDAATAMIETIRTKAGTHSPSTITTEIGKDVDQGLIDGMRAKKKATEEMAKEIAEAATTKFKNNLKYDTFKSYGKDAIQGAIDGAASKRKSLIDTFTKLARDASDAYADAMDINSPSKLFRYYSEMTIVGGARGAEENKDKLTTAYAELATAGAEAYQTTQEAVFIDPLTLGMMDIFSTAHSEKAEVMPLNVMNYNTDYSNESEATKFVFAPNVTVSGNDRGIAQEIKDQLREQAGDFFNTLERYLQQREDRNRRRVR